MFRMPQSRPLRAVIGFIGGLTGLWVILQIIEAVWSLISSDPLIPWLGGRLVDAGDVTVKVALAIGLMAILGFTLVVQVRIMTSLRQSSGPNLEETDVVTEHVLYAGADLTVDLSHEMARDAQRVSFSARQGRRVVAKNKLGMVDGANGRFRLPLAAEETRPLRDGYLFIQMSIITGEGNRTVAKPVAIATRQQVVRASLPRKR